MKQYDYIIIGAGCAGLSLLMRLLDNNSKANILLLDRVEKNTNDRTWCFWEKGNGYFDNIVYRKWDDVFFYDTEGFMKLDMGDYIYKMIRGIDFYNYCFERIHKSPGVDFQTADILSVTINNKRCSISTKKDSIEAEAPYIFTSISEKKEVGKQTISLIQHFKGWIIRTESNHLLKACLMDFRVNQADGTTFVYTLPLDNTRALVEYTVFSVSQLPDNDYDIALKKYLEETLALKNYNIEHTEFGTIPMTNAPFPFFKKGVYYIGTAGGQTKPSSGYTFSFIQKQSEYIAATLNDRQLLPQNYNQSGSRFRLYDSILLKILHDNIMPGKEVFSRLFHALSAHQIFRFLDNETNLAEELKVMNAMPAKIFLPLAIKQMIKQISP